MLKHKSLKTKTLSTIAGLVVGALAMLVPAQAVELTVATFVPPQHHTNTYMFKWLGDEMSKRSNGTLTLKIYPAGQLGAGPAQQYKRVVEGVADIVLAVPAFTPELFPRTMLGVVPGKSITPMDFSERMLAVFEEHLADEYSKVKLLSISGAAGLGIYSNVEMTTLEDWKGVKIMPFSSMTAPIIEAMGAVPVQLTVSDVYTALSTGTLDAAYGSYNNVVSPWHWGDVSKFHMTGVPVQFSPVTVMMNLDRYNSLSAEHRAIIDELAGEQFSKIEALSFYNADLGSLKIMNETESAGYSRVEVSPEEQVKMNAAVAKGMKEIYADYTKRGIDNAEEVYNAINK